MESVLSSLTERLKKEHESAIARVSAIERAMSIIGSLGGTTTTNHVRRRISAAGRRRISAAQKARWAKKHTASLDVKKKRLKRK